MISNILTSITTTTKPYKTWKVNSKRNSDCSFASGQWGRKGGGDGGVTRVSRMKAHQSIRSESEDWGPTAVTAITKTDLLHLSDRNMRMKISIFCFGWFVRNKGAVRNDRKETFKKTFVQIFPFSEVIWSFLVMMFTCSEETHSLNFPLYRDSMRFMA